MRKQKEEDYMAGNLVAMIDVVFQLIIFFVCTTNMQDKAMDDRIQLAMGPHGVQVEKKNPLEIVVAVDSNGSISIARTPVSPQTLRSIVAKARAEYGQDNVPVVIRGDINTRHAAIKTALDAIAEGGIGKVKFAALKEKGR